MDYTQTWPRCPESARFFDELFRDLGLQNPIVAELASRFRDRAGGDLRSLVDHWILPDTPESIANLNSAGLIESETTDGDSVWIVEDARLPRVRLSQSSTRPIIAIGVDDVSHFLSVNWLKAANVCGQRNSALEFATVALPGAEFIVLSRKGYDGFRPGELSAIQSEQIDEARRDFAGRQRCCDEREVIANAARLFERYAAKIGQPRAVHEFFAAERAYYAGKNSAAQWILRQQSQVGFGWANHEHHTFRSRRETFHDLIRLYTGMGFVPREKFFPDDYCGWGAQVLEHPVTRLVIFADVDLLPEEAELDFTEAPLEPSPSYGTIGLWCALHTSSIAEAGMNHIECEFDFEAASRLFESEGFFVMKPFTDLPMLKQRFTEAEMWPVREDRLLRLVEAESITPEQADIFRSNGAAGSHVEIVQRWEGFKGFSKSGVSNILRETDARLASRRR